MRYYKPKTEPAASEVKVMDKRLGGAHTYFKKAWQNRESAPIFAMARKILENVLQEDPKLLMWYDQALTRSGEDA